MSAKEWKLLEGLPEKAAEKSIPERVKI